MKSVDSERCRTVRHDGRRSRRHHGRTALHTLATDPTTEAWDRRLAAKELANSAAAIARSRLRRASFDEMATDPDLAAWWRRLTSSNSSFGNVLVRTPIENRSGSRSCAAFSSRVNPDTSQDHPDDLLKTRH